MTFFILNEFYNVFEMTIYIDVIFLENLILDFIILLTTKILCSTKIKIWRLLIGSIFGSFYTILSLLIGNELFIYKVLVSIVIILISFGIKSKKYFFKHLIVFYLTTITFGGASLVFIQFKKIFKILFLGVSSGFLLIIVAHKILNKKFSKICELKIRYKGDEIKMKALVDSRKFIA